MNQFKLIGSYGPVDWGMNDDLKKVPMHLLTDQEWKELSHVILCRDQTWGASKQNREPKEDHITHRIKVVNGMTNIALSGTRFNDQGRD
jgi:hypothetical protein